MQILNKKNNLKSEEKFHDQWAKTTSIDDINIVDQFKGTTSPEYKEALQMLGNVKGKKVLNLGCGLGEEAIYLSLSGAEVTTIDVSKQMLKVTKKLASKYGVLKKISYHNMSAEKLFFQANSFDHVLACNLLHHVDILKTIKQVKKVLKKNGTAIFSEPLAYNPLINIYRIIAHEMRTDHEHPITYKDLKIIQNIFPTLSHNEFHLFTLFIFVWFFVVEKQHPNKVRYWKKIITEAKKYQTAFRILYWIDKSVLKIFPFLKRYCWVTVIRVKKE